MHTLISGLSKAVQRFPRLIIFLTVAVTLVLGGLSQNFTPAEDSNDAFAPDAPELAATERISDLFGEESTGSVMQVILQYEGGNLFSRAGLDAVEDLTGTIESGALADRLTEGPPSPVVAFLGPALIEANDRDVDPATDEEVRRFFLDGYAAMPPGQSGFIEQMVPSDADLNAPYTDQGLLVIFTRGGEPGDDYTMFQEESELAADEIEATPLPPGITAKAFSFELLFSSNDEFQSEIGRLFGTAGLIITLVLALVFLIQPRRRTGRLVARLGILLVAASIVVVVLPTLGVILDSVFPDSLKDWPSDLLFPLAATLLLVLFLVWAFIDKGLRRTTADTVLTLIAILFAISWMNGVGYLLFEDMSPMAQILPILLIGLGVDYSIHVTSRYREEVSGGASVDDSVAKAIRTVGIALILATITTAVGFLTNVINEIPALREFGALAAIGIVASCTLMLTLIPAVRTVLDRRGMARETMESERLKGGDSRALGRNIGRVAGIARRVPAAALAVSIVLGGFGLWGWSQLESKFSFLDFIPVNSPLRSTFEGLIADFGGGFGETTQVLIEGDVSSAAAWNAMVTADQEVRDTPDILLFGNDPSGTSPVAVIRQMSRPGAPGSSDLVVQTMQTLGLDPGSLRAPAGADLSVLYDAALEDNPDGAGEVLHHGDTGYDAALFDFTTQAGEARAGDLRLNLIDDFDEVRSAGLSAVATSDEIIQDVVVTTLRNSQVSSLVLTLLAALVLLVVNFWYEARRPLLGVITTFPVVLVVLWSFGLMAAFGIAFGPVTATISALAIGIGIPYMIHITHRFLEDIKRLPDIGTAIGSTLKHTGGALAGSALTTVAGFGILVTSTTIPFRQFGFVTAYTILLAMLAALLLLPSLLVLWARWHQGREAG